MANVLELAGGTEEQTVREGREENEGGSRQQPLWQVRSRPVVELANLVAGAIHNLEEWASNQFGELVMVEEIQNLPPNRG